MLEQVNVGLFSDRQRKRLDRLVEEGNETADEAFDRWIRLLRWQSRSHDVGRPPVLNHGSGWGTYLQDADSAKRF